jgi:hypothetical protein
MAQLIRLSKRASEVAVRTIDLNPWLQSVNSALSGYTVGDVPDITESHSQANGVITVTLSGGVEGATYRVSVVATAASGATREFVLELEVIGTPASAPSQAFVQDSLSGSYVDIAPSVRAVNEALAAIGGGGAPGEIDGGTPTDSGVSEIDGGTP